MANEGPIRQVLRASLDFDRSLEEGWRLAGLRHDIATGIAFMTALGTLAAVWKPLSLLVTLPLIFLAGAVYVRINSRYRTAVSRTDELFGRYRAVLEESLVQEDWRRHANGHSHPLEDGEPVVDR